MDCWSARWLSIYVIGIHLLYQSFFKNVIKEVFLLYTIGKKNAQLWQFKSTLGAMRLVVKAFMDAGCTFSNLHFATIEVHRNSIRLP